MRHGAKRYTSCGGELVGFWSISTIIRKGSLKKIYDFTGLCEISDQVQDKISNQMFKNDTMIQEFLG